MGRREGVSTAAQNSSCRRRRCALCDECMLCTGRHNMAGELAKVVGVMAVRVSGVLKGFAG